MRWIFLTILALIALTCCFSLPEQTVVGAGEFSVRIPRKWASGRIVSKESMSPLYRPEQWTQHQNSGDQSRKPSYSNRPEHWAIRLPSLQPKDERFDINQAGNNPVAPQLLIHRADQWGLAFTDGIHHSLPVSEVIAGLRGELKQWENHDLLHGSPGYMDASLTFVSLKRSLAFSGGRGIRMICQWTCEPGLLREGELHYLFLGLSDDDSVQIIATFPVQIPDLPGAEASASHLGYSTDRYEELCTNFDDYDQLARRFIVERQSMIQPPLDELDAMITSIHAPHWK